METDEDEMLTCAVQASLRLHKEHQKNLEDAVVSQLENEEKALRESEAEAAEAQRARQGEEDQLRSILERSVADAEEARVRRRIAEQERARLDRLFGSGNKLGMDQASRLLSHMRANGGRMLQDDRPLHVEHDEGELVQGPREPDSVLQPACSRRLSGTPSGLSGLELRRGLNRPQLPAVAVARRNTSPATRQILSSRSTQSPEPTQRYDLNMSERRPLTTAATILSSTDGGGRSHSRVNRNPLPSIMSYSLDEILSRSRRDAFPTGFYTPAVEERNNVELQAAINESAGGRYRDEEEEAIRRSRDIPTYPEAVFMKFYPAPRGRRYVFQGPSSVTFDGEGGEKVQWEIVGDMDLGEAVGIANKNVDSKDL
ncbi:predicted protein [Histoplasma capsulatum var. duboisii H88]|uniref:Predicted protein n=2 Tax=Ajellomyces capsulatus TaxID=5037 RepID=F0UML4_AJEC8|nr:predicted protein [Histoplasma capsulatum H143]EGC48154.1 predicted protein [Histoplasma capsulatum var. duboisii H88]